jgi:hypothetical protein
VRSRRISSVRRPAKHHATTTARTSSNGYMPTYACRRSEGSRVSAACSSFSQNVSSMTLGSGPIRRPIERGVRSAR